MLKINNNILIKAVVLLAGYCLGVGSLGNAEYSPTSQQRRLLFDHEAQFSERRDLGFGELNTGKMGDYIDLNTGELSFRHTDISIPGNFDLPVEVTRIIDSDRDRPTFTKSEVRKGSSGTANWGLDLPYILLPSIDSSGTVGCYSASTAVDEKDAMFVVPRLSVPAQRWVLLNTSSTSNTAVFGSNEPDYTNNEMWKINQTKKNGKCAWTAIDTKGVTYEFGQTFVLATKNGKSKHAVLITKVTDVNGNTVTYTYDSTHKRLKLITGSDGRKIKLVYRSNGELECIITDNGKRVWIYEFKKVTKSSSEKYLSKVYLMGNSKHYWQYDALAGVYKYNLTRTDGGTNHARRCVFGKNARVRNLDGLVANYVTKKIVNFSQAKPGNGGREGTSHRAACLSPSDGGDFADGVSSYGNFSTNFTSAVVSKTLTDVDGSTAVWTYSYGEGDEFNSNQYYRSVHKNRYSPVYVDVTKPKTRTVTDPLGNKYEFAFGRSLNNSGLLLSVEIFEKGSKVSARKVEYEHVFSAKPLGLAWNRGKSAGKTNEHWSRTAKRVWKEGGETYNISSNFDSKGAKIKSTKASTVQTGSIVEEIEVLHISSKWILGLPSKVTVNGKEISGATYDTNGQITLETKYGEQFQRYKWNDDGHLIAIRNGADHITEFLNHKRGTPQKIILPNDAVYNLSVDSNGWVTRITNPLGYTENYEHNKLGWLTKIDRPTGYADTTITFVAPKGKKGVIKTVETGSTSRKQIEIFTSNGYGQTILHETRNTDKTVSIFVQTKYNKLGKKVFESWPTFSKTTFNGVKTKYDVLDREVQIQESVSPSAEILFNYLSDNRIQRIDENGNSTYLSFSGYGSPFDGKETLLEYPNLLKTYLTYDKWQNLTQIKHSGNGRNLLRTFMFNSRHQLCFVDIPEVGTEAYTYGSNGLVVTSEKGVAENYTCEIPKTVSISSLEEICSTRLHYIGSSFGFMGVYITFCNYKNSNRSSPSSSPDRPPKPRLPCNAIGVDPSLIPVGCSLSNPLSSTASTESTETNNTNKVIYSHNPLGLVTKIDFPSSANEDDIINTYNDTGDLLSATRGKVKLSYTYGKRRELLSETLSIDGNTFTTKNEYNSTGGRTSYTTPNKIKVSLKLNDFDQITSISVGTREYVGNITYHANDIVKTASFNTDISKTSNALRYETTLDSRMMVDRMKLTKNNTEFFSFSHSYFMNRSIKSVENLLSTSDGEGKRDYLYDAVNQLTSAGNGKRTEQYSFDLFANFLSKRFELDKVKYAELFEYSSGTNRLSKITNQTSSSAEKSYLNFTHDDSGNLTNYGSGIKLNVNYSGRIEKASRTGHFTHSFAYDALDNRVKFTDEKPNYKGTKYSFFSVNGDLLFEAVADESGKIVQNIDLIQFRNIAQLRIESCSYWIFSVPSNNLRVLFTNKNNKITSISASPFGSVWTEGDKRSFDPSARCESENSTETTTPTTTPTIPNFPSLPYFPPNTCFFCGLIGVASEATHTNFRNDKYLFRNAYRDSPTGFYYLPTNRFYDSAALRYLSPEKSSSKTGLRETKYMLNLYNISDNNPVSHVDTGSKFDATSVLNVREFNYLEWDELLREYGDAKYPIMGTK